MIKKVSLFCCLIFMSIFCMSATVETDNIQTVDYVEDGLVFDNDENQREDSILEQYESQLGIFINVVDNQFVIDYDSIESAVNFNDEVLKQIKENADFANELAEEKPDIVTINEDNTLTFSVDDEYAEQWDAWQLSWSFWKGWTYKLDSDFGKLVGISGIAYRLISYIANGSLFYKNIMSITDKSSLASTLSTLFFYLPGAGVKDIVVTYLQNYAGAIATGLVSINLTLMTLKHASLGTGWLIFKIVDFIVGRLTPSLITSCSMVYNCFKYNAPIYCKISPWTFSIKYSLSQF